MKTSVKRKQLEFEELKNGMLMVTYNPVSSTFNKKRYYTLFDQHTIWYNLAHSCMKDDADWVYINYLAEFVEEHHAQIIPQI